MDKLWPTLLILALLVLAFLGMWLGWRRRARRDSGLTVPTALAAPGPTRLAVQALHVASTYHDRPLDRVVVPGLAFRARALLTVSDGGVTLSAPGESGVAVAASAIVGIGAATWTIDRAVERDGLVLLAWRVGPADAPVIDTYLRLTDPAQRARLVDDVRRIVGGAGGAGGSTTEQSTTGSEN